MITKLNELIKKLENEPELVGKLWCVFLDTPFESEQTYKKVMKYKRVNFAWSDVYKEFICVAVWQTGTSEGETSTYANKMKNVRLGKNLGEAKEKIDHYYFKKETEKYNI